MKKAISLMLAFVLCLSLCACINTNENDGKENTPTVVTPTESTAIVIVNGETKSVTADDIIAFADRYDGCSITLTAKVVKIDGPRYFTSSLSPDHGYEFLLGSEFSDWCVHVGEDDPIINTIDIGDTVTVTGYIKDIGNKYVCVCGKENGDMYPDYTEIKIVE